MDRLIGARNRAQKSASESTKSFINPRSILVHHSSSSFYEFREWNDLQFIRRILRKLKRIKVEAKRDSTRVVNSHDALQMLLLTSSRTLLFNFKDSQRLPVIKFSPARNSSIHQWSEHKCLWKKIERVSFIAQESLFSSLRYFCCSLVINEINPSLWWILMIFFFVLDWLKEISIYRIINEIVFLFIHFISFDSRQLIELRIISTFNHRLITITCA